MFAIGSHYCEFSVRLYRSILNYQVGIELQYLSQDLSWIPNFYKILIIMIQRWYKLFTSQERNLTLANGQSASGGLQDQMSWRGTTASILEQNPSSVQSASGRSRGPTTSRCIWSGTCPKHPNDTQGEAGTSRPRLSLRR